LKPCREQPASGGVLRDYSRYCVFRAKFSPSNRGGINAGGVDEHYTSYLIDGIDNVDLSFEIFEPSLEIVHEVRIEQSGYEAEFGRNAGAVINVTTKSGTNDLHGSAWEFFRNDNLDARNFFAPAGIEPSLIRNQFGAHGGSETE
jgi:hypothetical protein